MESLTPFVWMSSPRPYGVSSCACPAGVVRQRLVEGGNARQLRGGGIGDGCPCSPLMALGIATALLDLWRELCLDSSRWAAAAWFRLRFSFLKALYRRPSVCVVIDIVEAFHHSAWLGGAWAFVAPGVC